MPTTPHRAWPYPAMDQNPYYATIVSTFTAQDADVHTLMTAFGVTTPGVITTASRLTLQGYTPVYNIAGFQAYNMQIVLGSAITIPGGKELDGLRITGTLVGSDITAHHELYGYAFIMRNESTAGGDVGDSTRVRGIIGTCTTTGPGSVRAAHFHAAAEGSATGVVCAVNAQVTPLPTTSVCRAIQISVTGFVNATDAIYIDSNGTTNQCHTGLSMTAAAFQKAAIDMNDGDTHGRIQWSGGAYVTVPLTNYLRFGEASVYDFVGKYGGNKYIHLTSGEATTSDKGIIMRTHVGTTVPAACPAAAVAGNLYWQAYTGSLYQTLAWISGIVEPGYSGRMEFVTNQAGVGFGARMTLLTGMLVGAPAGGDKGGGTINVSVDMYRNGAVYSNPAYVFEHWSSGRIDRFADREGADEYEGLRPLAEVKAIVRDDLELPLMRRHKDGGIFQRGDLLLASVEEAYLYLFEHDARIQRLEEALHGLGV